MSADVIIFPVVRIDCAGEFKPVDEKAAEICLGCLVAAIRDHHEILMRWLNAGGDARLADFDPLKSWGPILKLGADLNSALLKLKASNHQS
jgi:hypothetical protein